MYMAFCDGSIQGGNPGGWGVGGFVIQNMSNKIIHQGCVDLGKHPQMSNNAAEYAAVLGAATWLSENKPGYAVMFYSDSQLIVNQLSGLWKCHTGVLPLLKAAIHDKTKLLGTVGFKWIPRHLNAMADAVSRLLFTDYTEEQVSKAMGQFSVLHYAQDLLWKPDEQVQPIVG